DKVAVSVRLKEGDKERIQVFKGVVVVKQPKSGTGPGATFTVRKISAGVGVERVFPIHSPILEKIEIESSSEVRRSRLYFLRRLPGKKARLREAERCGEAVSLAESALPLVEEVLAPEAQASEAPAAEEKPKK